MCMFFLSSGTYPKILHFLLHYLHSCLPCPFCTEEAEVSLFLAYNPLLTLQFFFFLLCLYQRQSVKSVPLFYLCFSIRKFQKVSMCILPIQQVPHYLFLSFSSQFCYVLSYQFSSPVSGAGLCQRQQSEVH